MGALIGNFEKKPKEVSRYHFVGIAWNFFDPKEVSIMFNTLTDLYQMTMLAQYSLKGTAEATVQLCIF